MFNLNYTNMKVLKFITFLLCMGATISSKAQLTKYPGFIMTWNFCDADGGRPRSYNDYCRCESIYVVNTATYRIPTNPNPFNVPAMTGKYGVYQAVGTAPGALIMEIPASSWAYGQVAEIPIPCNMSFNYAAGLNFRIEYHQGPGELVTPHFIGATGNSLYLKTRTVTVNAGPDQTYCSGTAVNVTSSGSATTYSWSPALPTTATLPLFGTSPVSTDYTLTGTEVMNVTHGLQPNFTCRATDVMRITVNPSPMIFTPIPTTTFCTGTPLPVLSADPGMLNYSWSKDGNTLPGENSRNLATAPYGYGTYRYRLSNSYGCYSTSLAIPVTLSPSAAANFTPAFTSSVTNTGSGSINIGLTANESGEHKWDVYMSNAAGTSLIWMQGTSWSSSATHTFGPISTNIYVVVKHTIRRAPCNEEESLTRRFFESSRPAGDVPSKKAANQEENTAFQVSPNPSKGIFTVTLDGEEAGTVDVLDMLGKKVFTLELKNNANTCEIDLSSYPKGVYLVNVTGTNGFQSKKIVIE